MHKIVKSLIPSALVASVIFPPIGLGGFINLLIALIRLNKGEVNESQKALRLAQTCIIISIYAALFFILLAGITAFILGGSIVPPLGAFY